MQKLALALAFFGTPIASARQAPTPYTPDASAATTTADLEHARPAIEAGVGLEVFGAAGTNEAATWGIGGRLEVVLPVGLTVGGSYQQSFPSTDGRLASRPLLAEVGYAIAVAPRVEVRPMLGLGYAFVSNRSETVSTNFQSGAVAPAGFDVAPGAKISFLPQLSRGDVTAAAFEVYTQPKYHFVNGTRFLGVEVGAGARF